MPHHQLKDHLHLHSQFLLVFLDQLTFYRLKLQNAALPFRKLLLDEDTKLYYTS